MTLTTRAAVAACLAGVGLVAAVAAPSQAREPGGRMFERIDADADGRLSLAEIDEARRQAFDRADADGDGAVTFEEFADARPRGRGDGRPSRVFARLDADESGSLTEAEFMVDRGRFAEADADGDGFVTREEIIEGRRAFRRARD